MRRQNAWAFCLGLEVGGRPDTLPPMVFLYRSSFNPPMTRLFRKGDRGQRASSIPYSVREEQSPNNTSNTLWDARCSRGQLNYPSRTPRRPASASSPVPTFPILYAVRGWYPPAEPFTLFRLPPPYCPSNLSQCILPN